MKKERKVLIGLIALVLLASALSIPAVLSNNSKNNQSVSSFNFDSAPTLTKEKIWRNDHMNPKKDFKKKLKQDQERARLKFALMTGH